MSAMHRKQMIVEVLTLESPGSAESEDVVQRSLWLWQRIAAELVPMLGETGFQAVYGRAVQLALPRCSSFTLSSQNDSTDGVFYKLKQDLIALEHDVAHHCSTILLTEFADLVASMIGDAMVNQILRAAWIKHTASPDS